MPTWRFCQIPRIAETLRRRAAVAAGIAGLSGWRLLGCGAYFACREHPFDGPSDAHLLATAGVLLLPGTMFGRAADPAPRRRVRVAFANADAAGIAELIARPAAAPAPGLVSQGATA